jgi:hypothetical protein
MSEQFIIGLAGLIGTGLIPVLGILYLMVRQQRVQLANERKRLQTMILVSGRRRQYPH